jgi:N-acetyl-beta-hexosaminidase
MPHWSRTLVFSFLIGITALANAQPNAFRIVAHKKFQAVADAFAMDWKLRMSKNGTLIQITSDPTLAEEEYQLEVGKTVSVRASTTVGAAWALSTLGTRLQETKLRPFKGQDKPSVGFRGLVLDVARRYHSPSTLRTLIRWCNVAKVRTIQLHLTDDQNWMLPTKVFPGVDKNNTHGKPAYTAQELTDLQIFAEARGVSIFPEIDLPGHSTLLVKSNPKLFQIQGSESTNCINFGSPEAREKLKALLTQVYKLFPRSKYIHIGGDEAWYPNAEKDPQFAARGSSPQEVFVDFIADLAEHVIASGRTPIVWEGFHASDYSKRRIPKQTLVVAWEGPYYPAKQLIPDGFKVLNAGWDPYYVVNHYPYDVNTLVPLERLLNSSPQTFGIVQWGRPEEASFKFQDAKAVQGSMLCWWEGHEWNAQTILPPRILALGASLWNPSKRPSYDALVAKWMQVQTRLGESKAVRPEQAIPVKKGTPSPSLTTGCHVAISGDRDPQFSAQNLVDGISDDPTGYWLAYPCPQTAAIDLRAPRTVSLIQVVTLWQHGAPTSFKVEGSLDQKTWQMLVDRSGNKEPSKPEGYSNQIPPTQVRYLKLTALGGELFPTTMARILEIRAFSKR